MENLVSNEELSSYYKDKRILVTGHTGFKGAWLLACLHRFGAKIKGYALAPEYENSLFSLLQPLNISDSVISDIRNKSIFQKEIHSFQPDIIFHLAAQPLVRRSYEIPAETFEINVTGTANLLESLIDLNKKCSVVVITTDKVYENKEENILFIESDRLGGYDPYSASKACTEIVVDSFRKSFFNVSKFDDHKITLSSARAGNVIGGGDWNKDRIIPDIIKSLASHKTIDVRNPNSIRPWQHVLEPIRGYLMLGALLTENPEKFSQPYNFGPYPDDHLSVKELVELSIQKWGYGDWKDVSNDKQPHEAGLLQLDITRAINELNWHPKLNAATAINWTIDWYKQPESKKIDFTFQQIEEYFAL